MDLSHQCIHAHFTQVVAGAKAGAIAPTDVFLEAGPTGMEPAQTGFFQALGIATKVSSFVHLYFIFLILHACKVWSLIDLHFYDLVC